MLFNALLNGNAAFLFVASILLTAAYGLRRLTQGVTSWVQSGRAGLGREPARR